MPTAIWSLRLRSKSSHCNLELALEGDLALAAGVRECPVRSSAWFTAIWRLQLRSGSAHSDLALAVQARYSGHWDLALAVAVR